MEPPALPARAHRITLAAGQACRLRLGAGSLVVVLEGQVGLDGPLRSLAGQPCSVRRRLMSGAACRVDDAGWLRLWADTRATLVVVEADEGFWPLRPLAWLRGRLTGLRRKQAALGESV